MTGIQPNQYMFSLGPEKILGNLLLGTKKKTNKQTNKKQTKNKQLNVNYFSKLGNVGALCELVSTGKSGSFFFKSVDNR